jgi:hypothetical protein
MLDSVSAYLNGLPGSLIRDNLSKILRPIVDRFSSQATSSAGLVISTDTFTAKIGATPFQCTVRGVPVSIPAGTALASLPATYTISAGAWNVFCYFVDSAGTTSVLMGTQGATQAAVKFPQFPEGKTLIGYVLINAAGAFTGGSSAFSGATASIYVSPVGAFDPTVYN